MDWHCNIRRNRSHQRVHSLHPVIPQLKILPNYHNLSKYFHNTPWSAIGWTPVGVIPRIVGLSFFHAAELVLLMLGFLLALENAADPILSHRCQNHVSRNFT